MPDLVELTQLVGEMMLGLKTVVDQVQDLTNIIQTTQTAGATTAPRIPKGLKDTIACPKAWTGTGGSTEARHFLAAYRNSHNDAEIGRCTRKSPRAILSNSSGKPMWTH